MKLELTDKTAMVTGAGHGLGRAIATAFDGAGAQVSAVDINQAALKETAGLLSARSRGAVVDVTDRAAVSALVAEAGGQVDILVNCAGGVAGQTGRPLEVVYLRTGRCFSTSTSPAPSIAPRPWRRA